LKFSAIETVPYRFDLQITLALQEVKHYMNGTVSFTCVGVQGQINNLAAFSGGAAGSIAGM
jgi:hypothetical protein